MAIQLLPELLVNGFIFALVVTLGVYAALWYNRYGYAAELLAFIAFMIGIGAFQLGSVFFGVVTTVELKLLAANINNAVLIWLPVYSLLWFALAYSHDDERWLRWIGAVATGHILLGSISLAISPEFMLAVDGLITQGPVTFFGVTFQEWVVLNRSPKLPLLLAQVYGYAVTLASGAILGRYLLRNRDALYVGQMAALGVGIATPLLANGLVFAGVVPMELNFTDLALGVTGVSFAVAVFRYRLFRIPTVGRQQLVESIPDAIVMLDEDGRVVDSNPVARDLVDAPPDWRGMDGEAFFAPFSGHVEQFRDATDVETQISLTSDGTERIFQLNISPIRTGETGQNGRLIVLRDVTDRTEQLRQLERQNERLDKFATIISHDLRNPLMLISGSVEFIAAEAPDEHVERIERNVDRMETMIDDLLTMARAGQTIEATESVVLADAARAAWDWDATDGYELVVDSASTVTLQADPERLQQVLQNLFRNAVDHNEPPVSVRVSTLDTDGAATDGGDPDGFVIADDGVGIPNGKREQVFEHGYTTSDDGTGFGLSIVEEIVEAHGWSIRATESADGGARFEITGIRSLEGRE